MRRLMLIVSVVVLLAGCGQRTQAPGAGDSAQQEITAGSQASAIPEPTVIVPQPTIVRLPTLHVPEVSVSDAVITRARAIETGRSYAMALGEANPTLIDAVLTTQKDVRRRLQPPDGTPSDGPYPRGSGISDDAAVWLVRMEGSFRPDRGLAGELPPAKPGWMFVVLNAATGQSIGYGYEREDSPRR